MKTPAKIFFGVVSVGVIALWRHWFSVSYGQAGDNAIAAAGQIGDKFGALNTLFTGLAFVGVVATVWHQVDSSNDSRKELKETLDTLNKTANALEEQARHARTSAYVEALKARIDGYTDQMARDANKTWFNQLRDEQELLFWELAQVLEEARKNAGGREVTKADMDAKIDANNKRLGASIVKILGHKG